MKTSSNNITALFALLLMLCLGACDSDNVSNLQLSGDCTIEVLSLDNYEGKVNMATRTVTVNLPETYNTSAMTVTDLQLSEGAVANLQKGQTICM